MKLIQAVAGLLFVILLAAYCAGKSETSSVTSLETAARAALQARGLSPEHAQVIDGLRERVVCGRAGGQRFVYRDKAKHGGSMSGLVLASEMPPEQFSLFFAAWCES